jgi:hypothetical protein
MKRNVVTLAAVAASTLLAAGTLRAGERSPVAPRPLLLLLLLADDHKGPKVDLGKQDIAGYSVAVTQYGEVKPGASMSYEIVLSGGAGKPKAVRAWYGVESAEGSVKAKAVEQAKYWDADLELPEKLPDGSKLWVEVETNAGKKKAAFPPAAKK